MGATDPADGGGSAGRIHQVGLGIDDDGAGVRTGHQVRQRREFPPGPALPITQEAWPPPGRRRASFYAPSLKRTSRTTDASDPRRNDLAKLFAIRNVTTQRVVTCPQICTNSAIAGTNRRHVDALRPRERVSSTTVRDHHRPAVAHHRPAGAVVRDRGVTPLERAGRRSLTIGDRPNAKLRPRAAARSAASQYCRVAIEHSCHFSRRTSDDTTTGGPCFDPGGSALP